VVESIKLDCVVVMLSSFWRLNGRRDIKQSSLTNTKH